MATVTLTGLYLHDASDLSDFVVLRHATQPRSTDPRTSPIVYADGSLGAVTSAGVPRSWQFQLPYVSDDLLDELDSRLQRLQMLRSSRRSLRVYGFITAVSDDPLRPSSNSADITFVETTVREAS
jgi:hypothetical protein